jgi:hypothetical protein
MNSALIQSPGAIQAYLLSWQSALINLARTRDTIIDLLQRETTIIVFIQYIKLLAYRIMT